MGTLSDAIEINIFNFNLDHLVYFRKPLNYKLLQNKRGRWFRAPLRPIHLRTDDVT